MKLSVDYIFMILYEVFFKNFSYSFQFFVFNNPFLFCMHIAELYLRFLAIHF